MDGLSALDRPQSYVSRLSGRHIVGPGVAVMLIALQFQTLPIGIRVQTFPLSAAVAFLMLPFVLRSIPRTPLFTAAMAFVGFVLLHSVVALVIDLLSPARDVRFIGWARQIAGLGAGVVMYLVFRAGLMHMSLREVFRWILIGFIPPLILSILNIAWGAFGMGGAGVIVESVRDIVAPDGYTSAYRATGFTNEPSAWATSIVLTIMPAILYFLEDGRHTLVFAFLLLVTVVVFAWTFSTIGVALILGVLLIGIVLGPHRGLMFMSLVLAAGAMAVAITIVPSNQITRHLGMFLAGSTNISFIDRFFGLVGPFLKFFETWVPIGYGLGGVSTHFRELVPLQYQQEMLAIRWEGLPNITIMIGRLLAETGVIGLTLFGLMLLMMFSQLRAVMAGTASAYDRRVHELLRIVLFAVIVSLFTSIGPYQTPFLWLYMGLMDALYVRRTDPQSVWLK